MGLHMLFQNSFKNLFSSTGGFNLGSLLGFDEGGFTGQSGGIVHPEEFVINAGQTKKYRPLLEAINSGKAPAMAGWANHSAIANTYAPSLSINVAGSGNPTQDAQFAKLVAYRVNNALKANRSDPFRRTQDQMDAAASQRMSRAHSRNN